MNGARVDIGADEVTECGDGNVEFGEACDDGNLLDGDGCDSNCTFTACGNAIVTAGEQCDDGNVDGGDCCSAGCLFEGLGASCDDGELCSNGDACDGAGSCNGAFTAAPICKGTTTSGKAKLILKNRDNDKSDLALLRLSRGEATAMGELGDPQGSTAYELCVYDAGGLVLSARAPAGAKWGASGGGFKYKDATRSPDGVQTAKLKSGDAGKTVLKLKAKGANLAMPGLGLALPVVAQLRNDAAGCWGESFSSPSKNDLLFFKAKSD